MGRLGFHRFLDFFSLSNYPNSCLCMNPMEEEEDNLERKALMKSHVEQMLKLGETVDGSKTLAFHLEPKTVVLRVSMHCYGCARKVEKHISKMEGVTSFEVDLESKKVVVMGDITPFEVLESVSKVKFAELWVARESSKSASFDEGTNTQSSSSH
ncbi:protein SODIUM POTASSIUM ROOT DEFECTIVE 2-like [Phoenix dactylifera]|uniref:Protein SODIUM POTASSIUM ROOT DEFECTIVE 2-like n=1 Tax=Phoenix dactylifera TaxID=42345 RepID=A0A8B7BHN5_PHODC|nr:protein SODIUM POTASSIUM ROOT DEFECTIVE 2-like [Phoenix dactylifera]